MNFCASLQFNKNNYLTTGYSRNLLLAMSLVECLNSNHELTNMFIFTNIDKNSLDADYWLEKIVSTWLPKLFNDANFTKTITFSFNNSDKESGTITLDVKEIPIRFIYNDNDNVNIVDSMLSDINYKAELLLTTSNFSYIIGSELRRALKILLVEGANPNTSFVTKTLPISSISKMSDIFNDREKYAAYSVGINDIFIKILQAINNSASIEDLITNNSFFELINTSPLEITSSGNNIVSSAQTIMPKLKIDKIKYLRTFATSLKNKGDKIIIKLNSIKVDRQITKDSLNGLIAKKFNEATFSLPKCEAVNRSVNVKETDKLYFILTDTICEEIQPSQTDNKTIYEYNLRLVFEIDSIMKYMSKLVLLIVNNFSKPVTSK